MGGSSLYLLLALMTVGLLAVVQSASWLRRWLRRVLYIGPAGDWERREPSVDADRDAPSADQAYFELAERYFLNQLSTNDTFDTKATATLAVGSTVLPYRGT